MNTFHRNLATILCIAFALIAAGVFGKDVLAAKNNLLVLNPNSGGGGKIAFMGDDGNGRQIWVMNPDGSDKVQLTTRTDKWSSHPEWSPDGSKIAYLVSIIGSQSQQAAHEIWIMNADGSDEHRVVIPGTTWLNSHAGVWWHPNGEKIYAVLSTPPRTCGYADPEGGDNQILTPVSGLAICNFRFDPSDPMHQSIVGQDTDKTLVRAKIASDGSAILSTPAPTTLVQNTGSNDVGMWRFSPLSNEFAYYFRISGDTVRLEVKGSDGSNHRILTHTGQSGMASWSPDGTLITYRGCTGACGSDNQDIYVIDSYGTQSPVKITPEEKWLVATMPDWSSETNSPPIADAGSDQVAEWAAGGATVTLDGSGSSDIDEDPLEYTWTGAFLEGGGMVNGVKPSVTFPSIGEFSINLTVNDGIEDSLFDTVTITIVDTTPPEVSAAIVPIGDEDDDDEGLYRIEYSCSDICDANPTNTSVTLNRVPVTNGQLVKLEFDDEIDAEWDDDVLEMEAPSFKLDVTCEDASGNVGTARASVKMENGDDGDSDDDD